MIRTGDEYRAGLRDGREIWIDGERVADVTMHPAFMPIVDAKARMYDLAHDCANHRAIRSLNVDRDDIAGSLP